MSERCPLRFDEHIVGSVPDICRQNCQDKIETAVRTDVSEPYDEYGLDHDECNPYCELEFGQESIQKVGETAIRRYVITDECSDCRLDFGERGFRFECPYN